MTATGQFQPELIVRSGSSTSLPELRVIHDASSLEPVLDSLLELYDFREGARSGRLPSRERPAFRQQLLSLPPSSMHAAVVEREGRVVAGHVGHRKHDSLSLLLAARSPVKAELIAPEAYRQALGLLMRDEGVRTLEFPSDGPDLTGNPSAARARSVSEEPSRSLHARVAAVRWGLRQRLWSDEEFRLYRLSLAGYRMPDGLEPMTENSLSDLMAYESGSRDGMSLRQFLSIALERLEDGRIVSTVVEAGRLVHSCWIVPARGRLPIDPSHPLTLPPKSVSLSDSFTDQSARGRGLQTRSFSWRVHQAAMIPETENVVCALISTNPISRHNVEKAGFQHVASLFTRYRFGVRRQCQVDVP